MDWGFDCTFDLSLDRSFERSFDRSFDRSFNLNSSNLLKKAAKIIVLAVYGVIVGCGDDEGDEFEFIAVFGCEIQLWQWLRIEMMKVGGVVWAWWAV